VDDIAWLNTSSTAVQSVNVWLARHKSERPPMEDLEFRIERVSRLPTRKEQALSSPLCDGRKHRDRHRWIELFWRHCL
jgi:hypothetical protein